MTSHALELRANRMRRAGNPWLASRFDGSPVYLP